MYKEFLQQVNLLADYNQQEEFRKDVLEGLSKKHKHIPSKYFYDDQGSLLFNKITEHPDYYLAQSELEILENNKQYFSKLFGESSFNLIELGPGEGTKTFILFRQFLNDHLDFTYLPIDISTCYLKKLSETLVKKIPELNVQTINADFFEGLKWLCPSSGKRNVVFFLGSSIGNLVYGSATKFLKNLWSVLNHNDYVLIGFDLRKEISLLLKAYNDNHGITRDFNLNLLKRMNRELNANFNPNYFLHHSLYNPEISAMESYLLSTISQIVCINTKAFSFDEYEGIHLEYSHKYTLKQIEILCHAANLKIIQLFLDSKRYFTDALLQVVKPG
jgi:L-histidine Nalpha-methyltransferase